MSEAISRGTKAGMRRWYLTRVSRCRFPGCRTYLVRSAFQAVRRCAKHSVECVACSGKGYQLASTVKEGGTIHKQIKSCSICRSAGQIAIQQEG